MTETMILDVNPPASAHATRAAGLWPGDGVHGVLPQPFRAHPLSGLLRVLLSFPGTTSTTLSPIRSWWRHTNYPSARPLLPRRSTRYSACSWRGCSCDIDSPAGRCLTRDRFSFCAAYRCGGVDVRKSIRARWLAWTHRVRYVFRSADRLADEFHRHCPRGPVGWRGDGRAGVRGAAVCRANGAARVAGSESRSRAGGRQPRRIALLHVSPRDSPGAHAGLARGDRAGSRSRDRRIRLGGVRGRNQPGVSQIAPQLIIDELYGNSSTNTSRATAIAIVLLAASLLLLLLINGLQWWMRRNEAR